MGASSSICNSVNLVLFRLAFDSFSACFNQTCWCISTLDVEEKRNGGPLFCLSQEEYNIWVRSNMCRSLVSGFFFLDKWKCIPGLLESSKKN